MREDRLLLRLLPQGIYRSMIAEAAGRTVHGVLERTRVLRRLGILVYDGAGRRWLVAADGDRLLERHHRDQDAPHHRVQAMREQVADWHQDGVSTVEMARRLGCSLALVKLRLGEMRDMGEIGHARRPFTDDERHAVLDMTDAGKTSVEIGRLLHRRPSNIRRLRGQLRVP